MLANSRQTPTTFTRSWLGVTYPNCYRHTHIDEKFNFSTDFGRDLPFKSFCQGRTGVLGTQTIAHVTSHDLTFLLFCIAVYFYARRFSITVLLVFTNIFPKSVEICKRRKSREASSWCAYSRLRPNMRPLLTWRWRLMWRKHPVKQHHTFPRMTDLRMYFTMFW